MDTPSRNKPRSFAIFVGFVIAVSTMVLAPSDNQQPATAFKLPQHEQLVRASLAQFGIPADKMNVIVGDIWTGVGNRGSDQYQFSDFRHFDNAPDRAAVCKRADDAWTYFMAFMRANIRPVNPPEWNAIDDVRAADALSAFGGLTHSLQDFYSHSNWLEEHIARRQTPPTADALFPRPCDASNWPADLQTGFFDLRYLIDGCPDSGPPSEYDFCHETLNKDNEASPRGGTSVVGMAGVTYHQLAMQVASAHTTKLYQQVVGTLRADIQLKYPDVRADCVLAHLFQGSQEACRFGRLQLTNLDSGVALGQGTIDLLSPGGQVLESHTVQSWPPGSIQTSQCLPGLRIRYDVSVLDKYTPPTPRRVQGQVQVMPRGAACDATAQLSPRANMRYLVRFVNQDTKLSAYTNVTAVVNGTPAVSTGPIQAGTAVWLDLGLCPSVATYDFTIQFIDPSGTPRTATPEPPPLTALQSCVDSVTFNLGGQLY